MAENEKRLSGPKKAPKAKSSAAEGKSDLNKACTYIVRAVRAGVLSASLASQVMSTMGCGARTGLPEDEMAFVDKGDDGTVDAGNDGCMAVDAGTDGCMGVDAGGSKPGIDAGGSKGIDTDAGGSKGESAG